LRCTLGLSEIVSMTWNEKVNPFTAN
jgi:hypothetical protein